MQNDPLGLKNSEKCTSRSNTSRSNKQVQQVRDKIYIPMSTSI